MTLYLGAVNEDTTNKNAVREAGQNTMPVKTTEKIYVLINEVGSILGAFRSLNEATQHVVHRKDRVISTTLG